MASEAQSLPSESRAVPGFGVPDLVILAVMVTWGFNFIVIKLALQQLSPMVFTTVRHIGASVILLGILASQRSLRTQGTQGRVLRFSRRDWLWLVGIGLIGIAIHQPLAMNAVKYTTAGNAGLLLSSTPVLVALFNQLIGRERLSPKAWLGVVISFVGMALIVGGSGDGFSLSSEHLGGDLLAIVGVAAWAVYTIMAQPLLMRHDSLAVSAISLVAGTIPLALMAIPSFTTQNWQAVGMGTWLGVAYSGIIVNAFGFLTWNWGVKKLGGTRTALYSNLSPVITLILGLLILAEPLSVLRLAGAAIIIGGIYLSRASAITLRDESVTAGPLE
jgi:drug/metabolite transporter (DMT)-like permease